MEKIQLLGYLAKFVIKMRALGFYRKIFPHFCPKKLACLKIDLLKAFGPVFQCYNQ